LLIVWALATAAWGQTLARVKVPLAPVTLAADPASEQVTQVLLWDAVEVVKTQGGWASVLVPEQYRTERGYPGWIRVQALELTPVPAKGPWVAVGYPQIALRARPDIEAPALCQAYLSTRLLVAGPLPAAQKKDSKGEAWYPVTMPGGEAAWVRASQVRPEVEPALPAGVKIVDDAKRLTDTPYLWGGMSKAGIDCSGLIYVTYRMSGVTLPRDADQQFQVGEAVTAEELLPGDLVFFGQPGDITHVGMYSGKGTFVHASSGAGVISSPLFEGWYKQNFRGARRILKEAGGGTRVLTPSP
jgi:cell wall-associated NlpC family hydrolase